MLGLRHEFANFVLNEPLPSWFCSVLGIDTVPRPGPGVFFVLAEDVLNLMHEGQVRVPEE